MIDFRRLRRMPTAKLAMTAFPYAIDLDASADEAWAVMLEHKIRHLPVTSDGALVGIVTERDLRLVLRPGVKKGEAMVRSAYEDGAYVVDDDAPLDVVAREMARRQIGSALVTRHGKLVGILTTTDVCRLLADMLEACFSKPRFIA
jgi:acetoin utilization protein AcuB